MKRAPKPRNAVAPLGMVAAAESLIKEAAELPVDQRIRLLEAFARKLASGCDMANTRIYKYVGEIMQTKTYD